MSVQAQALRFRIWQYAAPRGWDVTFLEVAEALGTTPQIIGMVARHAGWVERFRKAASLDFIIHTSSGAKYYAENLAAQIVAGRVGVDA